jgi:hypothetical protein
MKNVHILPTDKPSRLAGSEYITNEQGIDKRVLKFKLWDKLIPNKDLKDIGYIPQNTYITSEEEIKKGDWFSHKQINYLRVSNSNAIPMDAKKIILTTDQDLIEDGVQAIDDEFLEWFVKNPSCEWVEVELFPKFSNNLYGIIIPQGEPKQETLEEAAGNYASKKLQRPITIYNPLESNVAEYVGFIEGAKWQQERMYSEEELEVAFFEGRENTLSFNEWFEQFKKK